MSNSEKIVKVISDLIEKGVLSSQDAKKEIITNMKFQRDNLVDKLQLVSRDEFNILKKLVQKQALELEKLKKKKTKRAKKS
tara:strand:+ start:1365 stop:1607 length:243 start_codon:yes stop_codon:yes gene_type:complete